MPDIPRPPDTRATLYAINAPRIGAPAEEQVAHVTREVNRVFALLSTTMAQIRGEIASLRTELTQLHNQ